MDAGSFGLVIRAAMILRTGGQVFALLSGVSIGLGVLLQFGCTTSLPPSVTCATIRSLKVGMSPTAVSLAIGEPKRRVPGDECSGDLGPTGECWGYQEDATVGGVKMGVDFKDRGLLRASIYERTIWMSESKSIFFLDAKGPTEAPDFETYFPCK